MIGIIFRFGNEYVEVRINGINLYFRTSLYGKDFVPLESLQMSREGVLREHPDLAGEERWKEIAIERLKFKLKDMANELERAHYIISDLSKFGYIPMYLQREGFRPEKL